MTYLGNLQMDPAPHLADLQEVEADSVSHRYLHCTRM
jgi:hypothetical protein